MWFRGGGHRDSPNGDDVPVVSGSGTRTVDIWRAAPGRPVLLEFAAEGGMASVKATGVVGRDQLMIVSVYRFAEFGMVPGTARLLTVEAEPDVSWTLRFATADDLVAFDGRFSAPESTALAHRQGNVSSLLRVFGGDRTAVEFYQDCACPSTCRDQYGHRVFKWICNHDDAAAFGPTTQEILWPGRSGIIVVNSKGDWSLEPAV